MTDLVISRGPDPLSATVGGGAGSSVFLKTLLALHPELLIPNDAVYGAADLSGNDHAQTLAGSLTLGGGADALSYEEMLSSAFDGSDDSVTTGYAGAFTDGEQRTFAIRAKRSASGANDPLLGGGFVLRFTAANVLEVLDPDGVSVDTFTPPDDGTATFRDYMLTLDLAADGAEVLVDGVSLGTASIAAYVATPGALVVGASGSDFAGAEIGYVCAVERILGAHELRRIAKAS